MRAIFFAVLMFLSYPALAEEGYKSAEAHAEEEKNGFIVNDAKRYFINVLGLSLDGTVSVPVRSEHFEQWKYEKFGTEQVFLLPITIAQRNGYDAVVILLPQNLEEESLRHYVLFKNNKKLAYATSDLKKALQPIEP